LAHVYEYQGVFSGIMADNRKDSYRMQKVDAKYLTGYLIIDDNPLQSLIFHSGISIANSFFESKSLINADQ
jgi:hypothetical protein